MANNKSNTNTSFDYFVDMDPIPEDFENGLPSRANFKNWSLKYSRARNCFHITNSKKGISFVLVPEAMKRLGKALLLIRDEMPNLTKCRCNETSTNNVVDAISVFEDDKFHLYVVVTCLKSKHYLFARIYYKINHEKMPEMDNIASGQVLMPELVLPVEMPTRRGVFIRWTDLKEKADALSTWIGGLTKNLDVSNYVPGFVGSPNLAAN